eukprot:6062468-Alexandrium_andersonii.AAC.1
MAVAREAATGLCGRSGRSVLLVATRFRRGLARVAPKTANKWARDQAAQYICKVRRCLNARDPL